MSGGCGGEGDRPSVTIATLPIIPVPEIAIAPLTPTT